MFSDSLYSPSLTQPSVYMGGERKNEARATRTTQQSPMRERVRLVEIDDSLGGDGGGDSPTPAHTM